MMKQLGFIGCLLLFLAPNAFSQSPPDIQSLAGLPGVAVGFRKYPKQPEQDGLSSKQIETEWNCGCGKPA